jgi:hypothetical protein
VVGLQSGYSAAARQAEGARGRIQLGERRRHVIEGPERSAEGC